MTVKWTVSDQKKINISEVIRRGRLKKGLSQKELADLMNIRPSLISKWENTTQVPRGDYLIQIANILDIVFDLFPDCKQDDEQKNTYNKMQKEIDNLWKAMQKRDQEQEQLKKTAMLLEERFSQESLK